MSEPLYLTKVEIDHETAFKAGLRDSYHWHQKVWQAFPGRDGASRDFLTRLDVIDDHFRLLILSPIAAHRPNWCPEAAWESKAVGDDFFQHSAYGFSLIANPTKKVRSRADGTLTKNGRRVPLTTREDLIAWLERKGEAGGFTVDTAKLRANPRPREYFIKKGQAGLHSATEFRGTLTVNDHAAFLNSFANGIGPAKAFGFGMLCLSPLS
ncbi:MAG: type I-E CRISPR-associated protein Cas6/Cse3/CasE [Verrucomicrobiae bacterium]|nr:type I-E CRISPR-associated protein Cas6/Cse3/CasE [Verrucomicrobiae bacterium]